MANQIVAGELYYDIDGQLLEIKRQIRQPNGYPFDPAQLRIYLQAAIEGNFPTTTDFYREMEQVAIAIPALSRPTLEELWQYGIVDIEGDRSPTEAVTLRLGTLLLPDEPSSINGLEYERRLISVRGPFGYQQLRYLVDHQDESQAFRDLIGKIYVDGPGIIGVDANGARYFPCLHQIGERWYRGECWYLYWNHVGDGLHRRGRIASSGK